MAHPHPQPITAICCHRCQAILASSDGATLLLACGRIAHQVTVTCAFCGATRSWKPAQRPLVADPEICYNTTDET